MKIAIDEPGTSLQQTIIENLETDDVAIIKTILELLDLQHDYFQVHKYYASNCRELTLFDKIRKEDKL